MIGALKLPQWVASGDLRETLTAAATKHIAAAVEIMTTGKRTSLMPSLPFAEILKNQKFTKISGISFCDIARLHQVRPWVGWWLSDAFGCRDNVELGE
jgi:hypothetical protein